MVHETANLVKRNYLYFLVEEGFRKNTASDRLREYLAVKFCERAEIEMRYIKLLQDWLDELTPPRGRQDGSECYMDTEIIKRLTTSLQSEAQQTIEARQRVYNCLMAEDGPYSKLQATTPQKEKATTTVLQLKDIFSHLDANRSSLEKEHKRNTEAREHLRHKVEDLESQLSQRSRLTSRRPPTRNGCRKVDDMRSRLSSLRQQHDDVKNKIEVLEKELGEMQKSAIQPLTNIDKDLQEKDMARMKTVIHQTQLFLSHLRDLNKGKPLAENLEVDHELMMEQWTDVQANARRLEAGEQFKLRELFAVTPQRPKSRMDGLITKPLASKVPASEIRNELANLRNRVFDTSPAAADDVQVERNSPASSPGRYWPSSSTRRSESSGSELEKTDHVVSVYEGDRRHSPSYTVSDGSIEEIPLPPEVRCPAELTRIEPNKQYATKLRLTRPKHESAPVQITDVSQVNRFQSDDNGDRSSDDDTEVAKQRDIRVVSISDNVASPGSVELPFKKGQVIKQKVGANEDGYCYGWTRDHMIGRKQYGYYRSCMVRMCRPGENSMS